MNEPEVTIGSVGLRPELGDAEEPVRHDERWKALARAEYHRFWTPRARRLWTCVIVLLEMLLILTLAFTNAVAGTPRQDGPALFIWFHGLSHLGIWGSAWIGSDGLSRQRADNPHPLRDPPPSEVFAGLSGKLAPFYLGYLLLLLTFTGACGFGAIDAEILGQHLGSGTSSKTPLARFLEWAGWSLALFSGSLAYSLLSMLFSGWFRRPRRLLVTATTMVPGTGVLAGAMLLLLRLGNFGTTLFAAIAEGYLQFATVLLVNPLGSV